MSLSENIKKYRIRKDMTQEHLAQLLGVSSQAVSKWETTDTYPDGTLLVPLANALEVSLDKLLDNQQVYFSDVSQKIVKLVKEEPNEKQFDLVRLLGWQMQKGVFHCQVEDDYNREELNCQKQFFGKSSYTANDFGFTQISHGQAPFFSVFPEPECGWREVLGDGELERKVFECLASPETMKAVLYLYQKGDRYLFEAEVLVQECGIDEEKLSTVMEHLQYLGIVAMNRVVIDNQEYCLYYSYPTHKLLALFAFAHEIKYEGGYSLQSGNRTKPYIR